MNKVGIVGAGQLGQMLGYAGQALGLECIFLDPADSPPAGTVGAVIKADFDDQAALASLAEHCDVISYEFENVPVAAVRAIESACPVYPPPAALECAQDRLAEKQLFEKLGIPIPGYRQVDSAADLETAADELGFPLVVKTRRLGYDGKGQAILRDRGECAAVVDSLGGKELIAEQFVAFDREVSAIGVRSVGGTIVQYALSENQHRNGILRVSRAPADEGALARHAAEYLELMLGELSYVGTLALELFVCGDTLLANEFAPRVHNSGHWTIEGTHCSQFENHMRAICGIPLQDPGITGFPGMVNVIGEMPADPGVIEAQNAVMHDYGKSARPGRKLAHMTVVGDTEEDRDRRIDKLQLSLANS